LPVRRAESRSRILTDEYLRTSAADVFAAGDAAQVFEPASGKHSLDSLW
jgi:NADPH-dependent 2,4-dienoyl-CoA reductase/sulfur reductase-like enzyme